MTHSPFPPRPARLAPRFEAPDADAAAVPASTRPPLPPPSLVRGDGVPGGLPRSVLVERRLTNRALEAWQTAPDDRIGAALARFFDHSLVVHDPAGRAMIDSVGGPLSARFGLVAGVPLQREAGLAEELVAACELVALQPMPIPFETHVQDPAGAQLLVRGLALPIPDGDDPAARVQIVLSWREILSKSAARRLRQELAQAFAEIGQPMAVAEPFPRRRQRDGL